MEQNTEVALAPEKQTAWLKMAVAVSETNQALVQMKDTALAKIADLPNDTKKIVEYENILKTVKAEKKLVVEKRMSITKKFDAVADGLMKSEKEFDPAIKIYEDALITVKQKKAIEDNAVNAKADEIKRIREAISNSIATQHADFEAKIANKIVACYEHALKTSVSEKNLPENIKKMQVALKEDDFTLKQPIVSRVYLSSEEVNAIWDELYAHKHISPNIFLAEYINKLKAKFEFYGIAFKNKAQSIALAKEQQATELTEIENKKEDAQIAAKLDALSTAPDIATVSGGKALKQVYKLNMPENEHSAIIIISAFCANWATAKEELGLKKWFNLSVSQMANALLTLKNKDNKFNVTGLIFEQTTKL